MVAIIFTIMVAIMVTKYGYYNVEYLWLLYMVIIYQ